MNENTKPVKSPAGADDVSTSSGSRPRKRKISFHSSLSHMGVSRHFLIAGLLISFLPALALGYILLAKDLPFALTETTLRIVLIMILLLVAAGYLLLAKYPISIIRLRRYLAMLSQGTLPPEIDLCKDEDDLTAISTYMSNIIRQTEERIRTIEHQTDALLEGEKRKVMIESLGAACHHIGQPATVINTYLNLMRKRETQPDMQAMIRECQTASDELAGILEKLQHVSRFETEDYRLKQDQDPARSDERILRIE